MALRKKKQGILTGSLTQLSRESMLELKKSKSNVRISSAHKRNTNALISPQYGIDEKIAVQKRPMTHKNTRGSSRDINNTMTAYKTEQ